MKPPSSFTGKLSDPRWFYYYYSTILSLVQPSLLCIVKIWYIHEAFPGDQLSEIYILCFRFYSHNSSFIHGGDDESGLDNQPAIIGQNVSFSWWLYITIIEIPLFSFFLKLHLSFWYQSFMICSCVNSECHLH